jgi:type IV fimbrial biogenesis protein FimT
MKKHCRKHTHGFTLTELMITVVILGITLSIGLPSFQTSTSNAKLTASVNTMTGSLQLARSQAIKAIKTAGVAPKTVDANGKWTQGLIVFVDNDRDGLPNPDKSEDLQYYDLAKNIAVTPSDNNNPVYRPDGRINGLGTHFIFAETGRENAKNCRMLVMANTGRMTCCKWVDSSAAWIRCDDATKQCTLNTPPSCPP